MSIGYAKSIINIFISNVIFSIQQVFDVFIILDKAFENWI